MTWDEYEELARKMTSGEGNEKIYGTAKDRDEERTLLNEIACGLGDLALVRKNGIALEKDVYKRQSLIFIIILRWRNNSSWTLHIQVTVSVHRLHIP